MPLFNNKSENKQYYSNIIETIGVFETNFNTMCPPSNMTIHTSYVQLS
jgi:hypothetical protein